ncbi:MAG: ACP phosphodiesterase [Pseudomonadota bacterium]|nr:ACP phosphodiesterase [Pseudomonadota bacterium]
MNYLAHFLLGGRGAAWRAGSLAGDFRKGVIPAPYQGEVEAAVVLHRRIDGYCARHPALVALIRQFPENLRRCASIVLDLAFDHHLSRHWRRFTDEPLPAFVAGVHLDLATQRSQLPRSAQRFAARLIDRGILLGYHRTANVHRALAFIGLRLHQPQLADAGVAHWLASYDQIDDNFAAFFPELAEYARTERAALQANLA